MTRRKISILGSTGSIGRQTLEVINNYQDRFQVLALSANTNIEELARQVQTFSPELVVLSDIEAAEDLAKLIEGYPTRVAAGQGGLMEAATYPGTELLVTAVVGFAGLQPTIAAIDAGIDIALANKETLVVAGEIVMGRAREKGVRIIPIDSEHSAIFQCLQGPNQDHLQRIILTASGGPFRNLDLGELAQVNRHQALRHPNWSMGAKITIDSATLMNKGLEVLEAHWLFGLPLSQIEVVVHPQSIVHSLVELRDGSVLGQCGPPDMRLPILYALSYPERWSNDFPTLDLVGKELNFFAPDTGRFPCLAYAFEAGKKGGTMPTVLNAVNEVAVAAFLREEIGFLDIPRTIKEIMDRHETIGAPSLGDIFTVDRWARLEAEGFIDAL